MLRHDTHKCKYIDVGMYSITLLDRYIIYLITIKHVIDSRLEEQGCYKLIVIIAFYSCMYYFVHSLYFCCLLMHMCNVAYGSIGKVSNQLFNLERLHAGVIT